MKRLASSVLIVVLTLLAAACGSMKIIEDKEKERLAIRDAIQKYLNERSTLNLSAMDWNIKEYNTDRDIANVQVNFTAKQGGATMVMEYELKREAGVWKVTRSGPRGSGGMAHPNIGGAQQGAPPAGAGELPPAHPPITPESKPPAKTTPAPKKSS